MSANVSRTARPNELNTREVNAVQSQQQPAPTQENNKKPAAYDLSYSLFPAPYDDSRFFQVKSSTTASNVSPDVRPATGDTVASSTQNEATPRSPPAQKQETEKPQTEKPQTKKRRRSPSPDVIPNPPGCSYGMDLRYFCYSDSEEEGEGEVVNEQAEQGTPAAKLPRGLHAVDKSSMRDPARSEAGPSKKVRFGASPENTPSKLRTKARATDPYHGRHFVGMGGDSPPRSPTPVGRSRLLQRAFEDIPDHIKQSPDFTFNTEGTYGFDPDDFSDSEDEPEEAPKASPPVSAPVAASEPSAETGRENDEPKQ